ncbi:MAG: hypothetical protein QM655_07665 [Nocardioidaceae bacterium]
MNQPNPPSQPPLPPDLPAEYADAYRRAYQDAQRRAAQDGGVAGGIVAATEVVAPEPPTDPALGRPPRKTSAKTPGWHRPAMAGAGVLVVLLAAYLLGRGFGGGSNDGVAEEAPAAATVQPQAGEPTPSARLSPQQNSRSIGDLGETPTGAVWSGEVKPVVADRVAASCRYPPSVDAAGNKVTYRPREAVDADFTTAWRCAGNGQGASLRLELPTDAAIAEIGLVPGYAKTDPSSHVDRYAENNRITKVRWTFDDGTSVVQTLDGSPKSRDLQTMRIAPVRTGSVTVTILASVKGPRDTVAISEISLGQKR